MLDQIIKELCIFLKLRLDIHYLLVGLATYKGRLSHEITMRPNQLVKLIERVIFDRAYS